MTIPNVTPAFTFQNPGLGAVFQQGVAGLVHAIQVKKQLDQADEELKQQQEEFELRQEQQKQNQLLGQEQIAQMRFNRKQQQNEFKSQQDQIAKARSALGEYGRFVHLGGDEKAFSEVLAGITDPDTAGHFTRMVTDAAQTRQALQKPQPREVTPSYQAIGISPDGQPLILNARTGQVTTGDGQMVGKSAQPSEQERRGAANLYAAQQGLDQINTLVKNGYSPLTESVASRGAQALGMDRTARLFSSSKGRLYRNAVKRVITAYLYTVSGANANPREIDNQADQQTTDLLDSPSTFEQKLEFLRGSVEAIRISAGRAAGQPGAGGPVPVPTLNQVGTAADRLQNYSQNEDWSTFMQSYQGNR